MVDISRGYSAAEEENTVGLKGFSNPYAAKGFTQTISRGGKTTATGKRVAKKARRKK